MEILALMCGRVRGNINVMAALKADAQHAIEQARVVGALLVLAVPVPFQSKVPRANKHDLQADGATRLSSFNSTFQFK